MGQVPRVHMMDGFIDLVGSEIASKPPERGGAILGFGGTAHLLVSDNFGAYTQASWLISRELSDAVGVLESQSRGLLMGTVHSHPAGIPDPSGPDVATTSKALDLNPHLDQLWIAVVTAGEPRELDVAIGDHHRMSVHVLHRASAARRPDLVRARGVVHPVAAHLQEAGLHPRFHLSVDEVLGADLAPTEPPMVIRADGRPVLAVTLPEDTDSMLFVDSIHPVVPPLAVRLEDGHFVAQPSPWDPTQDSGKQLQSLVRRLALKPDPDQWARVRPLVGSLTSSRVLVAGAGSVGSRIAEDLVRCGVEQLILIDPDTVSWPNLARSVYTTRDLERPKVESLAGRLVDINPSVEVQAIANLLSETDVPALLEQVELVVLATDDMSEQSFLAHWAYYLQVPQVACAMYRRGAAGEVVLIVPAARTPCWNCTVGADSRSGASRPESNYGLNGRLVGEAALGPAINLVASVASQLAVGLLAGPQSPAGSGLGRLLAEARTLGLVSTTPAWDFFPAAIGDLSHQHEPQSVWPIVEARDGCPVCGDELVRPISRQEGQEVVRQLQELAEVEAAHGHAYDLSANTMGKEE